MFKPVLSAAAIATLIGLSAAHAQTASPATTPPANPSVAMQTGTAYGGADAGKLIGRNIKNAQNETIGEIKSIHLDAQGKVDGVVASVGGFLGVGDREVLLAWSDLEIANNGEVVKTNMSKDQLKSQNAYTYKDPSYRGTVFSDRGVWRPDTTASTAKRSTGDFNVNGQLSMDALIGKTVRNTAGETVGEVEDVYVDTSGATKIVVVSVGGFLGMGAKSVGVPWGDLKLGRDDSDLTVSTNWTKDSLKAMPDYTDQRRAPKTANRNGG